VIGIAEVVALNATTQHHLAAARLALPPAVRRIAGPEARAGAVAASLLVGVAMEPTGQPTCPSPQLDRRASLVQGVCLPMCHCVALGSMEICEVQCSGFQYGIRFEPVLLRG
jgi:hypothetical protein